MAVPTTAVYFSESFPAAPDGNQLCLPQTDGAVPEQSVTFYPQLATTALNGVVKPDGTTVTIDPDGTIHAPSVGGTPGGGGTSASNGAQVCVVPSGAKDGSNLQYTIPAPVLAGNDPLYYRNGIKQRQLGTKAEFSIQGTQLTVASSPITQPLQSDDWHELHYVMGTPNSESGGSDGVTPVNGAVIRGSSSATTTSDTITVPLPAGSVAGDLAILFATHGYHPAVPSGWTSLYSFNTGTWNGFAASKILTSGDISSGHASVTASGSFDGIGALVTFIGPTGGVRETVGKDDAGGVTTDALSTSSAVLSTDSGIYFGSARAGSAPTVSMSPGVTLQTMSTSVAAGILADQAMPGGVTAQSFTTSGASGGFFHAIVIVKGS